MRDRRIDRIANPTQGRPTYNGATWKKVQRNDDAVDRLMQEPAFAYCPNRQRGENIRAKPPSPLFAKAAPISYGCVLVNPTDPGITSNKWSGR